MNKKIKLLLITTLYLFCLNSYSQEEKSKQEIEKQKFLSQINQVVVYNASLLGYAKYCHFDNSKINLVQSQFLSVIEQIGLKSSDYQAVQQQFNSIINDVSTNGLTNNNCQQFSIDFEKIYQAIKTGVASPN